MIWDIWWAEQKLRGSKNLDVLRRTVEYLGKSGNRKQAVALLLLAEGWLENRFKDNKATVRKALVAQGEADGSVIANALWNVPDTTFPYGDQESRRLLLSVLAEINQPDALNALLKALQDKRPILRRDAVIALHRRKDKAAATALIPLLEDADREVRAEAASALGDFGDSSVIVPLQEHLEDTDATVRRIASDSLRKLGWSPQTVREKALVAIADRIFAQVVALGVEAAEPLTILLRHGQDEEQDFALRALAQIGDARVLPHVLQSARENVFTSDQALDVLVALLKRDGHNAPPDVLETLATLDNIMGGEDLGQNDGRLRTFRLDARRVREAAQAERSRRNIG